MGTRPNGPILPPIPAQTGLARPGLALAWPWTGLGPAWARLGVLEPSRTALARAQIGPISRPLFVPRIPTLLAQTQAQDSCLGYYP